MQEKNFDVASIYAVHMLENLKNVGTLRFLINVFKRFVNNLISSKPANLVAVATKKR